MIFSRVMGFPAESKGMGQLLLSVVVLGCLLVGCVMTSSNWGSGLRMAHSSVRSLLDTRVSASERTAKLSSPTYEVLHAPLAIPTSQQTGQGAPQRGQDDEAFLRWIASSLARIESLLSLLANRTSRLEQPELYNLTVNSQQATRVPRGKQRYTHRFPLIRNVPTDTVLDWRPRPGKYMLAQCTCGRISNKRNCLQNYFIAAAVTGRALVIPTWSNQLRSLGAFYRFDLVLNVSHARACLGETRAIVTEAEYRAAIGAGEFDALVVDRYECVHMTNVQCPPPDFVERMYARTPLWLPNRTWLKRTEGDPVDVALLASVVAGNERLISLGDLFEVKWKSGGKRIPNTPYGPFNMTCNMLMQPHDAIVRAAIGFVDTFIGEEYMALHLRHSDFYQAHPDGFQSIMEVARCVREGLPPDSNISTVFIATDASELEVELLRRRLAAPQPGQRALVVITFPNLDGHKEWQWASDWNELNLDEDTLLAVPTAEKLICALSTLFRGNGASTFTHDIHSMRVALGLICDLDSDICFDHKHKRAPDINK